MQSNQRGLIVRVEGVDKGSDQGGAEQLREGSGALKTGEAQQPSGSWPGPSRAFNSPVASLSSSASASRAYTPIILDYVAIRSTIADASSLPALPPASANIRGRSGHRYHLMALEARPGGGRKRMRRKCMADGT